MAPMAGATGYGGGVMSYSYSKFGGDTENWVTITANDTYSLSPGQIGVTSESNPSTGQIFQRSNFTRTVVTCQVRVYTGLGTHIGGTEIYNAQGTSASSLYQRKANWIQCTDGDGMDNEAFGSGPYDNNAWGLYRWEPNSSASCKKRTQGQPSGGVNGQSVSTSPNGETTALGYNANIASFATDFSFNWNARMNVNGYTHASAVIHNGAPSGSQSAVMLCYSSYQGKTWPMMVGFAGNGTHQFSKYWNGYSGQAYLNRGAYAGSRTGAIAVMGNSPDTSPTGAWVMKVTGTASGSPSVSWSKNIRMNTGDGQHTYNKNCDWGNRDTDAPDLYVLTTTYVNDDPLTYTYYAGIHKFNYSGTHQWTTKLATSAGDGWKISPSNLQVNGATNEIIVGGNFSKSGELTKNFLIRLSADGEGTGTCPITGIVYSNADSEVSISNATSSMTSTSGSQSGQGSWQNGSTNTRAPAGTQSFEQDFISG